MPLNEEEFKAMANEIKMTTPWDLTLIVEKDNEMIGFLIAIPNLNQIFKLIKNGKLFPFGFFKLLTKKRSVNSARIMILGVLDEYRGIGIDVVLYQRIKEALDKHNITQTEACYVLESNKRMNSILKKVSHGVIKRYRMYERQIENNERNTCT
jgi:ribosomal protein S18 acetylase RimI-like enzyme